MKFTLYTDPIPQPRPRFSGKRAYETAPIKEYKAVVKAAAEIAMRGKPPAKFPIKCNLRFFRKYQSTSRRFGDTDNLTKAFLDSCNGVIFFDDSQVVSLTAEKAQSKTPRVEVEITPFEDFTEVYIKSLNALELPAMP